MKKILYKLLKRIHTYIGYLITKFNIQTVIDLRYIERSIGNYYRAPRYNKVKSREGKYMTARHVLRTVLRNNTRMSLSEIAEYTNSVNHATVIHSQKTVDNLISTNKEFSKSFNKLMKSLSLNYEKYNYEKSNYNVITMDSIC